MLYFAYGSNMSLKRIGHRCPGASKVGVFSLRNHQLRFNKRGQDGSAKCNVMPTDPARNGAQNQVYGVVYDIPVDEIVYLDQAESLGVAYGKETMTVFDEHNQPLQVFVYIALQTWPDSAPYDWYKTHVLTGAQEAGFVADYTAAIAQVIAMTDLDESRRRRELQVYG